jgi:antitoxin component of MazEF toxin-antitoxin module
MSGVDAFDQVTHVDVEADVRYWEDAVVDGVVDEDGSRIPGRDGDTWKVRIRIAAGRIEDWPAGVTARIHYKVCDQGEYWLSRPDGIRIAKWKGHYVPGDQLGRDSGGDYIVMNVDGAGVIEDYAIVDIDEGRWEPLALPDDLPPVELQRWACYVDWIDDTHVHLMMADETVDRGDEKEVGSFPRALLENLSPVEGQYVTVRVMSDRRIDVRNTVFTQEELAAGRAERDKLLELLKELREHFDEHGNPLEPDA